MSAERDDLDLKTVRKSLGLTQEKMAEAMGCDISTVWRIENGHLQLRGPLRRIVELMARDVAA